MNEAFMRGFDSQLGWMLDNAGLLICFVVLGLLWVRYVHSYIKKDK